MPFVHNDRGAPIAIRVKATFFAIDIHDIAGA